MLRIPSSPTYLIRNLAPVTLSLLSSTFHSAGTFPLAFKQAQTSTVLKASPQLVSALWLPPVSLNDFTHKILE